eukprot:TCONS_00000840-protein
MSPPTTTIATTRCAPIQPPIHCKRPVIEQPISPTFISTNLITPGRFKRETLPTIGYHAKSGREQKLWGQDTKQTIKEELAYSNFKPSHLVNGPDDCKVVVSHRHLGNRIDNLDTSQQPYSVTGLMLSKCRYSDQIVPKPFQSAEVHEKYICEPYPKEFCNKYQSHRCKFQLFPTNGVDLIDAETTSIKYPTQFKLQEKTKQALTNLHQCHQGTTTYNQAHEHEQIKLKPNKHKQRHNVRIKICVRTCKLCGLKINDSQPYNKDKEKKSISKKKGIVPKAYWPPGELNISNNQLNYPMLKLPKYCLRPQFIDHKDFKESEAKDEGFCRCKGKVPIMVSTIMVKPSSENFEKKMKSERILKRRKTPHPGKFINSEDTINPPVGKMSESQYERGFKTDAHHRFLKDYKEIIPNLSDAVQTGRKHDFFGWNVNFFRG